MTTLKDVSTMSNMVGVNSAGVQRPAAAAAIGALWSGRQTGEPA
jgi:hypothetical protein